LLGILANNHGKGDVYIDGTFMETVDFYDPTLKGMQVLYTKSGLDCGMHTIKVVVKGTKNASSSDYYLGIDGFRIYKVATINLFFDDFSDNNYCDLSTYGGTWSAATGKLEQTNTDLGEAKAVINKQPNTNFTFEADIVPTSQAFWPYNNQAGLIFKASDLACGGIMYDNYKGYYFGLDPKANSLIFGKANIGTWTEILVVDAGKDILVNETSYHVKIVVNDLNIKIYFDNVLKIDITDSTYSSGLVGIRTFNGSANYDNISVIEN